MKIKFDENKLKQIGKRLKEALRKAKIDRHDALLRTVHYPWRREDDPLISEGGVDLDGYVLIPKSKMEEMMNNKEKQKEQSYVVYETDIQKQYGKEKRKVCIIDGGRDGLIVNGGWIYDDDGVPFQWVDFVDFRGKSITLVDINKKAILFSKLLASLLEIEENVQQLNNYDYRIDFSEFDVQIGFDWERMAIILWGYNIIDGHVTLFIPWAIRKEVIKFLEELNRMFEEEVS